MRSFTLLRAAVALAAVAALFAAAGGRSWYSAAHDGERRYSLLREEVLRTGAQAVQNLNTLDYRNVDQGLALWQDSATDTLYQQLSQGGTAFREEISKARTVSTAKVTEGAVAELDERAGKARLLFAVQLTVIPAEGDTVVKRLREVAELTRTPTGWKLSALGQAPANGVGR